jgi:hypothetical protein
MARTWLLAGLSTSIGVLGTLTLAEAVLRLLPVRSGLQTLPVNAQNPVRRFTPNREFIFSKGWDFELVNSGRTNNFGFINDRDYDTTSHSPLLAIIGDSYVEAQMVPFPETMQGRLSRCVKSRGRVYSFGASGDALSGYLGEASFVKSKFRPNGIVVVIVGNDFDESLRQFNKGSLGSYLFRRDSTGLVLERVDYTPSLGRRFLRESALARYIIVNLAGGINKAQRLLHGEPSLDSTRYIGNTAAALTPDRVAESRAAIDKFLTDLPFYSGVTPNRTLLLVDAIRPNMYSDSGLRAASGSFFDLMRRHLMERAQAGGFEVVDMQNRFQHRHALDGSRFEYPSDDHWNGRGHEEAAAAITSSRVFSSIFSGTCTTLQHEGQRVAHP